MNNADETRAEVISESNFCHDIIVTQKKKLFERFLEFKQSTQSASVLTIAGTKNGRSDMPNLLMTLDPPHGSSQTVFGQIQPADSALPTDFRVDIGTQARQSISCSLPFADGEFDWVFCDTVIEHIGPMERQYLLLKELSRISRKGIFLTTVNRWHPFEFYTGLPLVHWLPESWWRRVLKWLGKASFAQGSRLNLLGAKELTKLASLLPRSPSFSIGHIRYLGMKASFFLQIRKTL